MKQSTIIYSTIWAVVIASTSAYISSDAESLDNSLQRASKPTRDLIKNTQVKNHFFLSQDVHRTESNIQINTVINSLNIQLKHRIQWASWYRDFITGKLNLEVFQEYLINAERVESLLANNAWILNKIQHTEWWQKYINWDISPFLMANSILSSYLEIEKLGLQYPAAYAQLQKNPSWIALDDWDWQLMRRRLFEQTLAQTRFIDGNPAIVERMGKFNLSKDLLYRTNELENTTWITELNAIFFIENTQNFPPEIWKLFWNSQIWELYKEWKINPVEAYNFILSIIANKHV